VTKTAVFISSAKRDAELATRFQGALANLGLDAFLPDSAIESSKDWRRSILAAIRRSDALLLIATPNTSATSWITYETGMAEALGVPIVVLRPDRFSVTELPEEVDASSIFDLDPEAPEGAAHEVAELLSVQRLRLPVVAKA